MLYSRYQMLERLKIVLKAQLKHVPGLGWALQHAAYLFLERHWEEDKPRIKSLMDYYKTSQHADSVCFEKMFFFVQFLYDFGLVVNLSRRNEFGSRYSREK